MTERAVFLDGERVLLGDEPLATGGQAAVFEVVGRPDVVVKIYHEPPDAAQVRRLSSMIGMSPLAGRSTDSRQAAELAWPIALARTSADTVVGYSMGRFARPEHVPLNALFSRRLRGDLFERKLDWGILLGVAWNLAYMTVRLHDEGIVVGDFSARNVVVNQEGFVTFLDCDSMAFTDPATGEAFRSSMHTPEYTAPERYSGSQVSQSSDDFALAVLVFQLLTGGNHPFGGVPKDADSSTSISMRSRISSGTTYVVQPDRIILPAGTVLVKVLPPTVVDLARRTFGDAVADPTARPTAAEWFQALEAECGTVRKCTDRTGHAYAAHLDACPWCDRETRNEADLFESEAVPGSPGPAVPVVPAVTVPAVTVPDVVSAQAEARDKRAARWVLGVLIVLVVVWAMTH